MIEPGARTYKEKWGWYKSAWENLGFLGLFNLQLQKRRARSSNPILELELRSKHSRFPLTARTFSSDVQVFHQIFATREYRCLDDVQQDKVELIVDCGANEGYSAAYFLSRFPNSEVIALEPDRDNYKVLKRNVAPYVGRSTTLNVAVWSACTTLQLDESTQGTGREWGRQFTASGVQGSSTVQALDIDSVLKDSGYERISLLKIDIEGAEAEVFAKNYESWLPKVDHIVIELHGPECEKIFHEAIRGQDFSISSCDELTVCKRADLPT